MDTDTDVHLIVNVLLIHLVLSLYKISICLLLIINICKNNLKISKMFTLRLCEDVFFKGLVYYIGDKGWFFSDMIFTLFHFSSLRQWIFSRKT